jgi:tetratricopeptide (TPR) repeat protein
MRGLLRLADGDLDAADEDIDRVLQRSPGSWEAHLARARVLHARDRIPEALAEIRLARPRSPDAEVELWTGKIAERSGRAQEAASAFRRARQLDPSLLEAAFLHGRTLLSQGLAREAAIELQAVTRDSESYPAAQLALGLALRERELLPDALECFLRAATLNASPEAHYWAGRTAAELERFEAAADQLGRAVALASPGAPWLADAQLWLGRTQHRRDRRAEASAAFTAYLQLAGPRAPARAEAQRRLRER